MKNFWYHPKNCVLNADMSSINFRSRFRHMDSILKETVKNKDVLDIGCNAGMLSFLSAKYGANSVFGIDIMDRYIKQANSGLNNWINMKSIKPVVKFGKINILDDIDLIDSYNYIILSKVLYHFGERGKLVIEKLSSLNNISILIQGNERHSIAIEKNPSKYPPIYGKRLAIKKNIVKLLKEYNMKPKEIVGGDKFILLIEKDMI